MTESNAYLAYGITVTTESLLYAVAAWPRLQGPFAFLNLVALRKRQGTLAARHSRPARQGVQTVPVEVWDLVRHKLVDVELRAAEVEHVESLMCECAREAYEADDIDWTEAVALCGQDTVEEGSAGLCPCSDDQAGIPMLSVFHLSVPTLIPICTPFVDEPPYFNDDSFNPWSATLVSLPSLSIAVDSPPAERSSPEPVIAADPAPLLPSDAAQRFCRLVSTLHLQPVDTTKIVESDLAMRDRGRLPVRKGRKKREFDKVALEDLTPRWMGVPVPRQNEDDE